MYILYKCLCQLVDCSWFVICAIYLLLIVHLFCSLFDYLFCFHFHWFFAYLLFKREKEQFWSWTVFRYFDPATRSSTVKKYRCSTSSSRVNKHHTADSTDFVLVQEAKEHITIIDKRDRRNQYSPYRQSQQWARHRCRQPHPAVTHCILHPSHGHQLCFHCQPTVAHFELHAIPLALKYCGLEGRKLNAE